MTQLLARILPILLALVLLSGCSDAPGDGSGGGIGGTGKAITIPSGGLVIGSVQGFGSIIINNRRFDTDIAEVTLDGEPAQLADLHVGMNVIARVDFDTMTADQIRYQPLVAGPIQTFVNETGLITVLGQTVIPLTDTVFDGISPLHLQSGMTIEVSGHRNSDNTIIASYIRLAPNPDRYFTVGRLQESHPGEDIAVLAGTQIDYAQFRKWLGTSPAAFEAVFLQPGTLLRLAVDPELFNVSETPDTIGFQLVTSDLTIVDTLAYQPGEAVEAEGVVSAVAENGDFSVTGITVQMDNDTLGFTLSGASVIDLQIRENERVRFKGVAVGINSVLSRDIIFLDRQ